MNRILLLICTMSLFFMSCKDMVEDPNDSGNIDPATLGKISFSMSIGEAETTFGLKVDSVTIKLTGPTSLNGKLTISQDTTSANGTFENLAAGNYTILINVFSGLNIIASGTGNATVNPGQTTTANIALTLGNGKLLVNVTWPSTTNSLTGILFTKAPLTGGGDIYKMNSDGTGLIKIIDLGGREDAAKLSPDLSKIVFSSDHSTTGKYEIFVANSDGSNTKQLTSSSPQYGNSGGIFRSNTKIWYGNAQSTGNTEINEINIDGTSNTKITNFIAQGKQGDVFDFNSDKSKILYYKQSSSWSPTGEIYVANIDWSGEINLTNNSVNDGGASISPDGTQIVFHRCEGSSGYNPPYNIFIMNLDGSQVKKLTTGSGNQYLTSPKFSPDGSKIAYSFNNGTQTDIYIMNLDGTNPVNITNSTDQNENLTDWK